MLTARRRARASAAAALLLASFAFRSAWASAPAPAQGGSAEGDDPARVLAGARADVEQLRYDEAVAEVLPLLSHAALASLYTLAPAFALRDPTLPPRVTTEFDAAAAERHPRGVTMVLRPSATESAAFEIVAGGETREVDLACRRSGYADAYAPVTTSRVAGAHYFRLPTASAYQCHAVALDDDRLPLGRLGSERAPFDVRPHAISDKPLSSRWWFWTSVGAVVVGGVLITYVATRPGDHAPPADATVPLRMAAWGR
jgi:hypothetical protein